MPEVLENFDILWVVEVGSGKMALQCSLGQLNISSPSLQIDTGVRNSACM